MTNYTLRYIGETKEDDSVTANQADDLRCAPLEKWGGNFICMGLCQLRDAQTVGRRGKGGGGGGERNRDNGKGNSGYASTESPSDGTNEASRNATREKKKREKKNKKKKKRGTETKGEKGEETGSLGEESYRDVIPVTRAFSVLPPSQTLLRIQASPFFPSVTRPL